MIPLSIVCTTYFPPTQEMLRMEIAERTIQSWHENIIYDGPITLIMSDDGSNSRLNVDVWSRGSVFRTRQERQGVGASLNKGFQKGLGFGPVVCYFVDDWSLTEPIDLTPWVYLLEQREDVGMVRLGPPHPNTRGSVEAFTENIQSWGMRLERYGYSCGHRPALWHRRMIEHYGWFSEQCSALECERIYVEAFNRQQGPDVVQALPSKFFHLDSVELAYVEPRKGS